MSGTHGGLLGVGGLRSLEEEVAPMDNPVVTSKKKTRNIRPKGVEQPKRVSRRGARDVLAKEIAGKESRELKSLLKTGGSGGQKRLYRPDKSKWNLNAKENLTTLNLPTRLERERLNRKAFASVSEIVNTSVDDEEVIEEDNKKQGTHHICNIKKIESTINQNLKCYCHVDGFIEYCRSLDEKFNELPELYSKFKSTKRNDKIEVNNHGLGIATDLDILCKSCKATSSVPAATTKFQDINMKGKYTLHKKSHRYQLNVKLTLGAIASGIGPTNLAQLLSFLDLPNVKQVNGRFFRNIE